MHQNHHMQNTTKVVKCNDISQHLLWFLSKNHPLQFYDQCPILQITTVAKSCLVSLIWVFCMEEKPDNSKKVDSTNTSLDKQTNKVSTPTTIGYLSLSSLWKDFILKTNEFYCYIWVQSVPGNADTSGGSNSLGYLNKRSTIKYVHFYHLFIKGRNPRIQFLL